MDGPDLNNRDPNELNGHVKVTFDEVLGEPDGAHSIDCVWTNSYKCYNFGLSCLYKFLTILCGICIALGWGCGFACVTFGYVWMVTPCLRLYTVLCGTCQKFCGVCTNCCIAPYCEALGLFFSKIHVSNK